MRVRHPSEKGGLIAIALLAGLLAACSGDDGNNQRRDKAHLVETMPVVKQNLRISRVRTGTLRARRTVKIFSQEEGTVTALPYFEGDAIKQGTVLAKLDDKLLAAQLTRAVATRKKTEQDVKRLKRLVKKKLVSEEELNASVTALEVAQADETVLRTRLGYMTILAPFDGIVTARLTEPGNAISKHTHLLTLADPASLITQLTVSGLVVPYLATGDNVEVRIDALGDKTFAGHITRIHPSLDATTRRGIVEVELEPVPAGASPGQLCRVTLNTHAAERHTVPFSALRHDTQGEYVYAIDENSKAQRRAVRSGLRLADRIEILEGLTEGEKVVFKGFLGLKPGKKVRLVNSNNKPGNKSTPADSKPGS